MHQQATPAGPAGHRAERHRWRCASTPPLPACGTTCTRPESRPGRRTGTRMPG